MMPLLPAFSLLHAGASYLDTDAAPRFDEFRWLHDAFAFAFAAAMMPRCRYAYYAAAFDTPDDVISLQYFH